MKNVIYYSTLFFVWLVIHLLLATALIVIGTIEGPFPSPLHALGIGAIIPEVWILSVGLAMFTRKALAKRILHKEKSFSKTVPIVLMTLGGVMLGANIVLNCIQHCTTNDTTQGYSPHKVVGTKEVASNSAGNDVDLLTKAVIDFRTGLKKEFEMINKKAPVSIDEITTLQEIKLSETAYTFVFQLNIDKNDFEGYYLEQIVDDFVDEKKTELYYDVVFKCAMAEVDSNEFFKAANIKIEYIFADANNSHIRTCGFEFKELAKE